MTNRTNVAVFFNSGDIIETEINGDRETIKEYYLNKPFNLGDGAGGDKMATAQDIVIFDGRHAFDQYTALRFAYKCKKLGFKVYLAERKHYGFITDEKGARVLSFGANFSGIKLSGNYKPSQGCGSGWQIMEFAPDKFDKEFIEAALYAPAPRWANPNPSYTTVESHLKSYGSSSRYSQI